MSVAAHLRSRGVRSAVAALLFTAAMGAARAAALCAGDCDGNGVVGVNELIAGVSIALGQSPASICPAMDRDADGEVTVAELLSAVNALLSGCSVDATATPSATATASTTPSSTDTPPPTPTATVNHPPVLPAASIYRAYPGFAVALPIGASDPEGGSVHCTAGDLPDGAMLDPGSGVLNWSPTDDQLGPFYVPVSCMDEAVPPAVTDGRLTLKVSPLDACAMPSCDTALGCTATLPPVTQTCCADGPVARVAEPVAGCPAGRVLFIGQNRDDEETFGRMQNCDLLFVTNFAQSGAEVQFGVETRCVNTLNRVRLHARLESNAEFHPEVFEAETNKFLDLGPDGFMSQRGLRFAVSGPGPFFDLQGAEGNLTVTLTDSDNVSVSESIRVRLTFTPRPDLPDVDPTQPPTPTASSVPSG